MKLIDIVKKESFVPINYKLTMRYKFYSTIINECFESFRESNNEYIMKNMIILVFWFLLMGPPSSLRICSIQQWIIFITFFKCTIYVGKVLGHMQLYGGQGIRGEGLKTNKL